MCREQKISIPRPVTHGASHDETGVLEADIADVVRANLHRRMKSRGLSLQGLAEVTGVSPAALADLAEGRSFPALGLLWKLARALDLPCTVFIEEPVTVRPVAPQGAWRVA
jgi:ribosome-binding protein aMBF1 (putative translation factor)